MPASFCGVVEQNGLEPRRSPSDSGFRLRSVTDPIWTLSGGNQQKAVIARALGAGNDVVIMDEPTNGVDLSSRIDIHSVIGECASEGVAMVIGSSDPEELMGIRDRILVLSARAPAGEFEPPYDVTALMLAATGGLHAS